MQTESVGGLSDAGIIRNEAGTGAQFDSGACPFYTEALKSVVLDEAPVAQWPERRSSEP